MSGFWITVLIVRKRHREGLAHTEHAYLHLQCDDRTDRKPFSDDDFQKVEARTIY